MTQRDKAIYLDIDVKTLRTWKKTRPNLYKMIMLGFAFEEAVKQSKENYEQLAALEEKILQEK
jgi:hypothetical protein